MEAIERTYKDSKKTCQDSQEVKVQTSQSIKKIQTWMGSSKRVFKDYGKVVYDKDKIGNAPKGHQKIRVHFVFDVKHWGSSRQDLWQMDILPRNPWKLSIQELSP